MRIEITPEHALARDADQAIADLLQAAFGTEAGFGGRSFHKQRHHLRIMAWAGPGLIGHVALHLRAIGMGAEILTIAGVAEVATHPDHQGRGIGSALMKQAIAQARDTVAEAMVLFGHPGLYAPLGFKAQSNPVTHIAFDSGRPAGVVTDTIESLMVLPLGSRHWDGRAAIDLLGPLF
ncbi:GNAT family N-acetyltransferase [Nioella nitratireducens]|uniref:GNAT family N-acetyltransferase n=1 Tax=Nioella nitratireducens TaxID=1287720 RepID=UPI0008FD76F2|nr:GNAT family N-acetyltransferase [Nioella nitratireducens]